MGKKRVTPEIQSEPKQARRQIALINKVFIVYMSVLMVVLTIINVLDQIGYHLKNRGISMLGLLLLLFSALVWGEVNLFRRLKTKAAKMIGSIVMVFVAFMLGMLGLTYTSQFAQLIYPSPYSVIESAETGNKAAVLRGVDTGMFGESSFEEMQERMAARYAEISDEPVSEEEGYPLEAYGYVITAYPEKLSVFYEANADVEGEIYIGYASEAKLLYEWLDGETLRLYLENPEIGDSGEIRIRF